MRFRPDIACERMSARRFGAASQRGQSMVEFIIVLPALLLLVLGAIQFSLVLMAKSTLDNATFLGVRDGTLNNASVSSINDGIAKGLAPLFQRYMQGGQSYANYLLARAQALLAVNDPTVVSVTVLNPTPAAFQDFGESATIGGQTATVIPNSRLMWRSTAVGGSSGENIQDANLLKIRVRYCFKLDVPFIQQTITGMAAAGILITPTGAFDTACYAGGGMPLQADATMLMQSPAVQ